jgi:hypothetical protein
MVAKAPKAVTPKKEIDLDIETSEAITRTRVIAALESGQEQLTLSREDRRAAARMLRSIDKPRVRVSKQECAHLAAFYWRDLKRRARQNGRRRWNAEQRMLAAKQSIELTELRYPTRSKSLKPADVLKLVDQPLRKTVKRKNDNNAHTELRNKPLLEHFESINCLRLFGFALNVPREVEISLGIWPISNPEPA